VFEAIIAPGLTIETRFHRRVDYRGANGEGAWTGIDSKKEIADATSIVIQLAITEVAAAVIVATIFVEAFTSLLSSSLLSSSLLSSSF
jgi:hypothetical protein